MAWTTPRTWSPGEKVTAAMMNQHVRDQMNVLKTQIDDDGSLRPLLKGFGFSAGNTNGAGSVDTQFTGYDVTIPANFLSQPGDALLVEGILAVANNADAAKLCKVQLASATIRTIMSTAANIAAHIVPFRLFIVRRTSTTGAMTGLSWPGAAAGGVPTNYLINFGLSAIDWTTSQVLKIFGNSATASTVTLTDYRVASERGLGGVLV